jgi:hypothetical protein
VRIPARLLAAGCLAYVVSWTVSGLSLALTLCGVTGESFDPMRLPMWSGAMAVSASLGFAAVFVPGGLGVREGILMSILQSQPGIEPHAAIAVTVLSRIISFIGDLVAASLVYRRSRKFPGDRSLVK